MDSVAGLHGHVSSIPGKGLPFYRDSVLMNLKGFIAADELVVRTAK
uniref:Uncharacterized protein n=1 Tax=Candidatus Berkiella cookevillensis TaxID=437022 RepID=A0A0Q9YE93_9GAMM